jgi:hypothetical protein
VDGGATLVGPARDSQEALPTFREHAAVPT